MRIISADIIRILCLYSSIEITDIIMSDTTALFYMVVVLAIKDHPLFVAPHCERYSEK